MEQVSISSAYTWAFVVAAILFLVAAVVANMILYKPNNPGTATRRVWFWVLGVMSAVLGFVINQIIAGNITVPSIKSDYLMHASIAAGVSLLLYILCGFVVSKLFPKSKVGTWF